MFACTFRGDPSDISSLTVTKLVNISGWCCRLCSQWDDFSFLMSFHICTGLQCRSLPTSDGLTIWIWQKLHRGASTKGDFWSSETETPSSNVSAYSPLGALVGAGPPGSPECLSPLVRTFWSSALSILFRQLPLQLVPQVGHAVTMYCKIFENCISPILQRQNKAWEPSC